MEWLSDDPTYLASGFGLVGLALLIALRVTQQGKYLVAALSALTLAGLVLVVEWCWVTDNERIEQTVYDLARAVARSDADATLGMLTPDVQFVTNGATLPGAATRALIRGRIQGAKFDFLKVSSLRAHAGRQSRRGSAEFRVLAGGSVEGANANLNFGTLNSDWSLGLRETSPEVWKVERIAPVSVPGLAEILPRATGNAPPRRRRPRFGDERP